MKIPTTITDQAGFIRAQADLFSAFVTKRFGEDSERGEFIAGIWWTVGLVILAVAAIALITAKVNGKLGEIN